MKKIYTEEQRNEILQRYRSGEKVSSICEDTGIAKSTLYAWTKSNNKKKSKAINMSDFRILRQRCETLEKMVEVLFLLLFLQVIKVILLIFLGQQTHIRFYTQIIPNPPLMFIMDLME